nr:sphingomyelin phosphodiesterase-like [Leptinotarsa decemlineata]
MLKFLLLATCTICSTIIIQARPSMVRDSFNSITIIVPEELGGESEEERFTDDWNYRLESNKIPVLSSVLKNHTLPPTSNGTSRLLWELDQEKTTHLPQFVDKALKLLNLKQVAFEIENSVMSKVSCTACKAGAGLLQHYTRTGKSEKEIKKTIYRFCVNLKIQSPRVCEGITELFAGEVIYVLSKVKIGADEICSFVIGDACGDVYNPYHEWEVMFPPVPKPKVVESKIPEVNAPTFKVLHLSDTHYDPYYMEGSNADCGEPLCCRLTNGLANTKEQAAGKWGDYRKCDSPKITVDNMLDHIQETHPDIDYILWTGDLPPHDIWNQTKEENLNSSMYVYECVIFVKENMSLFEIFDRNHSQYYAIISRYESTITAQFFGHTHYDEFEVFYDHKDLGRAVSIGYVGPSVTPYYDLNPGYRIYYVDGDHDKSTRAVVDHESWTMNLREANLYGYPIWFKLYTAKQAFGLDALRPQDWDELVTKMSNDPKLFELFYKYYYKASPARPSCDIACKKKILCDLHSGRSHDRRNLCEALESRIDSSTSKSWKEWIYNTISVSMSVLMSIPRLTIQLPKYVLGLG